jgi:hypothetical protein
MILWAAHAGGVARMNPNSKATKKQKKRRDFMVVSPLG